MSGSVRLNVRFVADNDERRAMGLMHAAPLAENEAALFVFPRTGCHAFWNKNVSFPLSLAFLDENRRIVHTADMKAGSTESCAPPTDNVRFVVEASQGTWARLGVTAGDFVDYHDNALHVMRQKRL